MADRLFRHILLSIALIFLWPSCKSDDPSVNASRLRIKLTDATSLVLKELHVDIREVSVFLVDTAGQKGEWITLKFSGKSYDVLKLMNGKTVQLVDQYVAAGRELQKIKLGLGNGSRLITNTDKPFPLHTPSNLTDGIVIDVAKTALHANTIYSMIIDLNAAGSVRESNGSYFLHPKVRAFPETYGGKLRGFVAPLAANPVAIIIQNKDTLATFPQREGVSSGDDAGMFMFMGLKEGEWEVRLLPHPESGYRDTVFVGKVELGKTTEITPNPIRLKPIPRE